MAQIAEPAPPQCSVCWQTRDDIRHVDFETPYEGPVIMEGVTPVAIDQIVICESCLKEGCKLVGLVDWAERGEEFEQLRERLTAAEASLVDAQRYAGQLEQALHTKPEHQRSRRSSPKRPASMPTSTTA